MPATGETSCQKMAARNRRANVPDVDNTIDLVQVDGLVCKSYKLLIILLFFVFPE